MKKITEFKIKTKAIKKDLEKFCEHLNSYKGMEEVRFDFMLIDFLEKQKKEKVTCKKSKL
jgi:hypothetical protein